MVLVCRKLFMMMGLLSLRLMHVALAGRTRRLLRYTAIKHGGRCKALHRQSKGQEPEDCDLEEAGHGRQYKSEIKD